MLCESEKRGKWMRGGRPAGISRGNDGRGEELLSSAGLGKQGHSMLCPYKA